MEVYWAQGCQIYVTPVDAREVCVTLMSRSPELRIDEALERHFPTLRERLPRGAVASRERGAVTPTMKLRDGGARTMWR